MDKERGKALVSFSIRIPESLRRRVKGIAALNGIKVQDLITELLEKWAAEHERGDKTKR